MSFIHTSHLLYTYMCIRICSTQKRDDYIQKTSIYNIYIGMDIIYIYIICKREKLEIQIFDTKNITYMYKIYTRRVRVQKRKKNKK